MRTNESVYEMASNRSALTGLLAVCRISGTMQARHARSDARVRYSGPPSAIAVP
jgi:hypothetical protein